MGNGETSRESARPAPNLLQREWLRPECPLGASHSSRRPTLAICVPLVHPLSSLELGSPPACSSGCYKSSPVLTSTTGTQEPEFLFVYPYGLYPSIQCYVALLRYFVSGFQILRKMSLSHLTILAFSTCHVLRTVQAVNKCFF